MNYDDGRYHKKHVKVLCFFKGWAKVSGRTVRFFDSVMIKVQRSQDIEEAFKWEMARRIANPPDLPAGPLPRAYELMSFLPENGRTHFNVYRD